MTDEKYILIFELVLLSDNEIEEAFRLLGRIMGNNCALLNIKNVGLFPRS